MLASAGECHYESVIANLVDQSRDAFGGLIDGAQRIFRKNGGRIGIGGCDSCANVLDRVVTMKRLEVTSCCDSLIEGIEFGASEPLFEFGAAGQDQ